jgi:hypothetical protein
MKKVCCIVTIIKYDYSYLKEFIDYHTKIGISKFIIYNNGKKKINDEYSNCIIIDFPGDVIKRTAYNHFSLNILNKIEEDWILFIDYNEYLVTKKHITIQKFIEEYENYKSIGIIKKIFSTNGHINKPNGLIIENYTLSNTSKNIKTLIHKDIIRQNINKKIFENLDNILNNAKIINDTDIVCINNYLKSWSELIHKIKNYDRLESHHKYNFLEFKEWAYSENCNRDTDILKLLSIKNYTEYNVPENEKELVDKLCIKEKIISSEF